MSVSLKKGQKVDLRKSSGESLNNITVGLGWDPMIPPKKGGFLGIFAPRPEDFDCDASVFVCTNGKVECNADVVYFNNLVHSSKAIRHMGDNLTGNGEGDDEQVKVTLSKVPASYDKIVFVVTIYRATERKQHFGMLKNAFIRIVDDDTHTEMCRYDLVDNYDGMKSMIFAEVYRHDGGWKFNAIGQGTDDTSLPSLLKHYQ